MLITNKVTKTKKQKKSDLAAKLTPSWSR